MSPRGGALRAAVAALLLSAGCREVAPSVPGPDLAAQSCRLRLRGPLQADLPCQAIARERPEGWLLAVALPEGGPVAGSIEQRLQSDGPLRGSAERGGHAYLWEPASGRAFGGPTRGGLRVSLVDGRPAWARLVAVVSPTGGGRAGEPVRLVLELAFEPASEVAQRLARGR